MCSSDLLVKMGTTAAQKKLFFNLRRVKGQIEALEDGDLKPEHVKTIAHKLGVPEEEVVNMNRRLTSPDSSLNAPMGADSETEWQDWLADDSLDQETQLAESEELEERKTLLSTALEELTPRERDILEARRLRDEPVTLEDLSAKYGISREQIGRAHV